MPSAAPKTDRLVLRGSVQFLLPEAGQLSSGGLWLLSPLWAWMQRMLPAWVGWAASAAPEEAG